MWCRREFVITIPVRLATTCGDTGNTLAAYLSLPAFKLRLVARGGGADFSAANSAWVFSGTRREIDSTVILFPSWHQQFVNWKRIS